MRTIRQKIIGAAALFIAILTTQSVFAYYNPSTGRFLSRDPIGEAGFQAFQMAEGPTQVGPVPVGQQSSRWISRNSNPDGNLYHFVKNNALSFWDVLGLYVNLVYDVANKTLTVTDVDTKKTLTLKKVYSGNGASCCKKEDQWKKGEGPLPTGKYLVGQGFDSGHGGDDWWYTLYGNNGKGGYSPVDIPVTGPGGEVYHRGGFYIHTGRESDGCVTVWSDVSRGETGYPKSDDYNKLKEMLDKTKPLEYKGSGYSGWLEVK